MTKITQPSVYRFRAYLDAIHSEDLDSRLFATLEEQRAFFLDKALGEIQSFPHEYEIYQQLLDDLAPELRNNPLGLLAVADMISEAEVRFKKAQGEGGKPLP